jgi:hypothetical protein
MGLIQKSRFCRLKAIDYQQIIFLFVVEGKFRPRILKKFYALPGDLLPGSGTYL